MTKHLLIRKVKFWWASNPVFCVQNSSFQTCGCYVQCTIDSLPGNNTAAYQNWNFSDAKHSCRNLEYKKCIWTYFFPHNFIWFYEQVFTPLPANGPVQQKQYNYQNLRYSGIISGQRRHPNHERGEFGTARSHNQPEISKQVSPQQKTQSKIQLSSLEIISCGQIINVHTHTLSQQTLCYHVGEVSILPKVAQLHWQGTWASHSLWAGRLWKSGHSGASCQMFLLEPDIRRSSWNLISGMAGASYQPLQVLEPQIEHSSWSPIPSVPRLGA